MAAFKQFDHAKAPLRKLLSHIPEANSKIRSLVRGNNGADALGALPGAQQPDHRGADQPKLLGDNPLADPLLVARFHFWHEPACGHWPSMRFPILSGLIDSRLHTIPQNIPYGFRKDSQHACESAAAGGIAGARRTI